MNKLQYLVQLKRYGPEENSWEPEENIHASRQPRKFHQRFLFTNLAQKTSREHPGRRGVLSGLGSKPATSAMSDSVSS